jgi:molecular chaperone DnaJ
MTIDVYYDKEVKARYERLLWYPRGKEECEWRRVEKSLSQAAMKYHPDRNKDDKTAEEKFKEINDAYAV